jgi:flagellar basal body-associated protein FliL
LPDHDLKSGLTQMRAARASSLMGDEAERVVAYAGRVFPWIIFAVVAVPLVVVGFAATRRRTAAGEHPANEDAQAQARIEQEFADAEAFEAEWREKDKERYRQEHLP